MKKIDFLCNIALFDAFSGHTGGVGWERMLPILTCFAMRMHFG